MPRARMRCASGWPSLARAIAWSCAPVPSSTRMPTRCRAARSFSPMSLRGPRPVAIVSGKLSGPQLATAYATRGELYSAIGAHQAAVEDLDRALASGSRDAEVYNTLAWLLATSTQDGLRNAQRAKELALTACELTRYQEPNYVDTLAAAHAEAGEFADAIRFQQKALESPEFDKRFGKEARERLALYAAGRPYRGR